MYKKGFTLIELLIVIAIIGVLASVILITLGGKTDEAGDAVKRVEANQLKSLAALYASGNNISYTGFCKKADREGDEQRIFHALSGLTSTVTAFRFPSGSNPPQQRGRVACRADDKTFIVAYLESDNNFGCVDSNGISLTNVEAIEGLSEPSEAERKDPDYIINIDNLTKFTKCPDLE